MGEGQSKPRAQTSSKSSVATGDIKPEDLNALHARCLPKGLKNAPRGEAMMQAAAPAAAPVAAPAAAPMDFRAPPLMPMGLPVQGQLQRSSSMVRTSGQLVNLQRSDSMVRTGPALTTQAGSLVVPIVNMQRSDSMVRTSAQQDAVLPATIVMQPGAMQRSSSMVRTSAQQEAALNQVPQGVATQGGGPVMFLGAPPVLQAPNFPRSSSLLRSSVQQEAAMAQNAQAPPAMVPVANFPRSSSLVRTCAQQEAAIAQNAPASFQFGGPPVPAPSFPRSSSLLRTSVQQEAAMAPNPAAPPQDMLMGTRPSMNQSPITFSSAAIRTQVHSIMVDQQDLAASQRVQPSTQAPSIVPSTPSTVPAKVLGLQPVPSAPTAETPGQASRPFVQYIAHEPHAPRADQREYFPTSSPQASQRPSPPAALPFNPGQRRARASVVTPMQAPRQGRSPAPAKLQQMRARDIFEQQMRARDNRA